jgi:hypothetical protein
VPDRRVLVHTVDGKGRVVLAAIPQPRVDRSGRWGGPGASSAPGPPGGAARGDVQRRVGRYAAR